MSTNIVTPGRALGVGSAVFFVKKESPEKFRVYAKYGSKARAVLHHRAAGSSRDECMSEDILREVLAASKQPLKYCFTARPEGGWTATASRGHIVVVPPTVIVSKADAVRFATAARRAAQSQPNLEDLAAKYS